MTYELLSSCDCETSVFDAFELFVDILDAATVTDNPRVLLDRQHVLVPQYEREQQALASPWEVL